MTSMANALVAFSGPILRPILTKNLSVVDYGSCFDNGSTCPRAGICDPRTSERNFDA